MEEKKEKRVLRIELDDDVKKVSITGKNGDEQVVMSQELDEDDLDQVAGGACMVIAIFWFYVWYYRNKKSTK